MSTKKNMSRERGRADFNSRRFTAWPSCIQTFGIARAQRKRRSMPQLTGSSLIGGDTYGELLNFVASAEERDGSLQLAEVLPRAHLLDFLF